MAESSFITPSTVTVDNIVIDFYGSSGPSEGNTLVYDGTSFSPANIIPVGTIEMWAGDSALATTPPAGWLLCDGTEKAIATYTNLSNVIGTRYGALTNGSGSPGSTHFRLPNVASAIPVGIAASTTPTVPSTATLFTSADLSHSHAIDSSTSTTSSDGGTHNHAYSDTGAAHNHTLAAANFGHYHNTGAPSNEHTHSGSNYGNTSFRNTASVAHPGSGHGFQNLDNAQDHGHTSGANTSNHNHTLTAGGANHSHTWNTSATSNTHAESATAHNHTVTTVPIYFIIKF